ncbi:MAG: nucleotidyltransferase domain-containing protein [Candidatus Caldarchaeum sp.]
MDDVVSRVREAVDRVSNRLGLLKVVVFGSYAVKRFTAASDVDILIVYDEQVCDGDTVYNVFRTNLSLERAELHLLSKKYESMRDGRWLKTVAAEGVVVCDVFQGLS